MPFEQLPPTGEGNPAPTFLMKLPMYCWSRSRYPLLSLVNRSVIRTALWQAAATTDCLRQIVNVVADDVLARTSIQQLLERRDLPR